MEKNDNSTSIELNNYDENNENSNDKLDPSANYTPNNLVTQLTTENEKPSSIVMQKLDKLFNRIFVASFGISKNNLSNQIIIFFIIAFITWAFLYVVFQNSALPGGIYFSLFILIVASQICGFLFELIKLPSLLGINHILLASFKL